MTKQQAIQESYIEYWVQLPAEVQEQALQNDGWISIKDSIKDNMSLEDSIDMEFLDKYGYNGECVGHSHYRPKSLQGIENNNGWIKIESEESLPKEYDFYDACCFSEKFPKDVPMFYGCNLPDLRNYFNEELITHYRPIVKHDYPIF